MALEGFEPQFSKLGPATKMVALQTDSSNFFHSKRIEINEKQYNDPIWITKHDCCFPKLSWISILELIC
jgi:hypothetical protein